MKNNIKYLIMDVDGTLTDGKLYIGNQGEQFKVFDVKDGYGIKNILSQNQIRPIVLTARTSKIVEKRCNELGITACYQGIKEKEKQLKYILEEMGESDNPLKSCAYIGDDIPDLQCMIEVKKAGGIIACPANAIQEVCAISDYVCKRNAGNGAVREFIEWLTNIN